jgi:hypothetical protein
MRRSLSPLLQLSKILSTSRKSLVNSDTMKILIDIYSNKISKAFLAFEIPESIVGKCCSILKCLNLELTSEYHRQHRVRD